LLQTEKKILRKLHSLLEVTSGDEALSQSPAFGWYFCLQVTMTRVALVTIIAPLSVRVLAQ